MPTKRKNQANEIKALKAENYKQKVQINMLVIAISASKKIHEDLLEKLIIEKEKKKKYKTAYMTLLSYCRKVKEKN